MKVRKATCVCGVIYRSPSDDLKAYQKFRFQPTECLEKLDSKRKCFLFGHFNYDLAESVENTHVRDVTEVMLDHNFYSLINKPTLITSTGATVLDQIWTNSYPDHIKSGIILHSISDHLLLFMSAANSKVIFSSSLTRNFNDMNIRNFDLELENIDVNPVLTETKTDESYKILVERYQQVFNKSLPLTQLNSSSKNNWFDKDLQQLLSVKEKMFKKFCVKKTFISKVNYNKAKKTYFRTLKE